MPTVSELMSQNIGNTLTNVQTWNGVIYNVKAYGAKGDGSTDDSAKIADAITAASTNGGIVYFPPGTYIVGSALTFPSNVTAEFSNGAKLSVNSGITVTINGPINAGLYQIFSGAGTVAGTPKVDRFYPQWFGAKGDGVSDDATFIQKSANIASTAGGGRVHLSAGQYLIGSGIEVPDNVYIIGEGPELTKILAGANSISLFTFTRTALTDSFSGISGITLNVNAKTSVNGITSTLSSQLKFSNLRFTGDFLNTFLCDRGRSLGC